MKYVWLALLILAVLLLLWAVFCLIRKKWACRKVLRLTMEEKCRKLNDALSPYGFCYRPGCDCFCSTGDAWQKKMGYCRFYDEYAPLMNMVIDCEPVYFTYDNRNWMIEFWKGQYGMTAGAEIGIYATKSLSDRPARELFYYGVEESEQLQVTFALKHGNALLLKRSEKQWWLTGFCLGGFVWPGELSMEACVQFNNAAMRNAFYEGLIRAGYRKEEIQMNCCSITFCLQKPRTPQPSRFSGWYCRWIQRRNRRRCRRYLRVTRRFACTLDRVTYLGYCFPGLYRCLIRFGRIRSIQKAQKKYNRKNFRQTS